MKVIQPKINSMLKYHGGKSYLAKHIIPLMQECDTFVDATVGAGNILLNIEQNKNRKEIAIDLDEDLIYTWETIQYYPKELHELLLQVQYTEETFNNAIYTSISERLEFVKNFIIKSRMSRGGLGKSFAWSDRLRGGIPGDVNGWNNFVHKHYHRIVDRIQNVQFIDGCLSRCKYLDDKHTVCYIDPPYVKPSRVSKNVYKYEMETHNENVDNDKLTHEGLWQLMDRSKCKFYLSGYYNNPYNTFIQRMKRPVKIAMEHSIANHSSQRKTKEKKIEVLWEIG